jgi:ATP-binding cassette, subfamily C, bacterial
MRYHHVPQHCEEDCGAACLATIAKHYRRTIPLSQIREVSGTGWQGTTLLGLKQGAEALGFNARSVKASPDILHHLNQLPLPAIIHWQGHHWVVLYGKRNGNYVVADPAVGVRYVAHVEIAQCWIDGVALLLEPDPIRFFQQPDDRMTGIGSFFQRAWAQRVLLMQALPINLILGLLSLTSPFLLQVLTDDVLVRGDGQLLTTVAIAVIATNLISSGLSWLQSTLIAHFAQRLELGIVLEFGRKLLRLPLTYYEGHRSGEIVSRLQDIQQVNQLVSQVIVSLPSQFFVAVVSLALMIFYSGKLTMVAMVVAIGMTLSTIIFQPTLQQKTRNLMVAEAETQGVLVETFKAALTLKTTDGATQLWEEFQNRFSRLAKLNLRTMQIGIVNGTFSGFVSGTGGIALLWVGGSLVMNPSEHLSIGQLLAFKAMNDNFLGLIATLIGFVDEFTRAKTAVQRITEVIEAKGEADIHKPAGAIASDDDIICDRLSFYYAGRLELLNEFSLKIPGGKVTTLIGASGCGKSTLAKLLAGLYQPSSGDIQIGRYHSTDISLTSLRQQVVLVPQEAQFWSRSILENFQLSTPAASFDQIVEACQIVGADRFIAQLPDKYHTVLGEFGANLSGGQRQRLAIARALINQPPVLILDESTSGLDPASEAEVMDHLLEHRQGKTTILISHRPSVIQRADWVVRLDQETLQPQDAPVKFAAA